ncbi:hypothetical protein M514_11110 [Trichuris suis]|uniref:Dynein light chain n=1 Tax=Trichuris suis TaxID=68888 RepID=A0A085LST2_9BILA|nr:hypothetical protein M513_11110 [Trichuris suis]KFD68828.1 hypothetical protein M514_11110 [Trichuris suis]
MATSVAANELDTLSRQLSVQFRRNIRLITCETALEYCRRCIAVAADGLGEKKPLSEIAGMITCQMSELMGHSHWYCVFGKRYGSSITHEKGYYIFFEIDQFTVMVFRHTEDCEKSET